MNVYFFDKIISSAWSMRRGLLLLAGVNQSRAELICARLGLSPDARFEIYLGKEQRSMQKRANMLMRSVKELGLVTKNIEFTQLNCVRRLIKMEHYRGRRHMQGLPVRGQRTRANAGTQSRIGKRYISKL